MSDREHANDTPAGRPLRQLRDLALDYPALARQVDQFRAGKGSAYPDWPDWCLLPMAAWHEIARQRYGERGPMYVTAEMQRLAAVGAWRYTKGVYVVDPDIRSALEQSDITGDLPAEVLTRLPEWSLYLVTPGMSSVAGDVHGVWVHLERDMDTGADELRLVLDTDTAMQSIPVHLGPWSVVEAMERAIATAQGNVGITIPRETAGTLADIVTPLVSMVLYLCSEEPEIDNAREPGASPSHPQPRKTKRGWRLFAPDQPTVWMVGREIGADYPAHNK